ncbi:MAG: 4a-hydroxytetrahydrobiopterin dehydratase [bacterium]|nr:4a-hydroxytetrahydrobiopterin dehydratase [bacterium]
MAENRNVLSNDEVDAELKSLDGWTRDGVVLSKDFVLKNFKDITAFLQHLVGTIAAQNHHPDFSLNTGTRTIAVAVTTHSEGAVTCSDIGFATTLNAWRPKT